MKSRPWIIIMENADEMSVRAKNVPFLSLYNIELELMNFNSQILRASWN